MQGTREEFPLVSCVIIFLNGEKYIGEAIDSVIAQSYPNWELILVDDGTTDGATAIAKRYAAAHPDRIVYTEHPNHENRGMSASRNAGIRLAKGKYVAFLDADDIWLPERLARHVDVMESNPEAAICVAPTLLWSSWDKANLPRFRPWLSSDMVHSLGIPSNELLRPPYLAAHYLASHGAGMPGICSLLVRRDRLEAVGCFNEDFRGLYEDQIMLFKMFLNWPVIAIDDVLDYYRQHPESACSQGGHVSGDLVMRPRFLEWLQTYLIQLGVTDPQIWQAFRGEMLRFDNPKVWQMANLPHAIIGRWGMESRRAVMWLLTPKFYHKLRLWFGMKSIEARQPESGSHSLGMG